jgi:4a-hydroxytetrahydrobiopterin dehydratase
MYQRVTPKEFHAEGDLVDWRVVLGHIEAQFRASSFAAATEFVARVVQAADEADHHPDIDLRYPGIVRLSLMTHATNGLTTADVALARSISALATEVGLTSDPSPSVGLEVAIDALDIDAVRPFWRALLDYEEVPPEEPGGTVFVIVDPRRIGPQFWFQQMDAPRSQRNRIHIDVSVPHDIAEQRVSAAVAAGGHIVSDARARAFWVLADCEGNEACVCTWQDRG